MVENSNFYHYLPVTDDTMRWGLYVTGGGRGIIPANQLYPAEGHPQLYQFKWAHGRTLPEFQMILITRGQGTFESTPTGIVPIAPNSIIILFPGIWHRYRPDRKIGWQERWLSLNGEIAHRLMDQQIMQPDKAVQIAKRPSQLIKRFDRLLDHIHAMPTENTILLSLRAMDLVAEVIEQTYEDSLHSAPRSNGMQEDIQDSLVLQALNLIWSHSHRPLSVNQLAERLPATRRTLERHFMQACGHSILDEINTCRLSRAKRLITETDLPMKTIAFLAGFTNPERMRVTFTNREGHSPAQFRKQVRT